MFTRITAKHTVPWLDLGYFFPDAPMDEIPVQDHVENLADKLGLKKKVGRVFLLPRKPLP